jgi:hypothetical protein
MKERRTNMAYAIVHYFPGGTKEQYEASIKAVHPGGFTTLPQETAFEVYNMQSLKTLVKAA